MVIFKHRYSDPTNLSPGAHNLHHLHMLAPLHQQLPSFSIIDNLSRIGGTCPCAAHHLHPTSNDPLKSFSKKTRRLSPPPIYNLHPSPFPVSQATGYAGYGVYGVSGVVSPPLPSHPPILFTPLRSSPPCRLRRKISRRFYSKPASTTWAPPNLIDHHRGIVDAGFYPRRLGRALAVLSPGVLSPPPSVDVLPRRIRLGPDPRPPQSRRTDTDTSA